MAAERLCCILDGIHALHSSLLGTASHEEFLVKHLKLVRDEVTTQKLSFEDAARLATKLKSMHCWQTKAVEELVSLVGQRVCHTSSQVSSVSGERKTQDYVIFPQYLTESLWKLLLDPETSLQAKMHHLCKHLSKIGLRAPSEPTLGMIFTVLNVNSFESLSPQQMYEGLTAMKPMVKSYCDASMELCPYVQTLPDDRSIFEKLGFTQLDEPFVDCGVEWSDLMRMYKMVPLRKTNKFVPSLSVGSSSSASGPCGGLDLMGLMQGFASVMQQATNQRLRILSPRKGTPLSQAVAKSNSLSDIREQSRALVSSVDQGATLAPKAEVLSLTDGAVEERKPMSPLDAFRALEEKTDK